MTNIQHTPGPWFFTRKKGYCYEIFSQDGKRYWANHYDKTDHLNIIAKTTEKRRNSIHNARLIAAAPELLEALEAAKAHMENPYPAGDDLSHVLARAGEAIAKARGKS